MSIDPAALAVAATGVLLISFMKGAFGGDFAIIGIPLLALVMDPLTAGALLAPLFLAMDFVALYYWRPSTWSRPDLSLLVPGLIAGIVIGYLVLSAIDRPLVSIIIAVVTLGFAALWLAGGGCVVERPRSPVKAVFAGLGSGVTTMVAHSGGPPLAMYLLPLGLSKAVYAGTTSLFFTIGNLVKAGPWLLLGSPTADTWTLMALCLPAVPIGIWSGWQLHQRLDQQQMYRACYALLVVTALKLLWDGVAGWR